MSITKSTPKIETLRSSISSHAQAQKYVIPKPKPIRNSSKAALILCTVISFWLTSLVSHYFRIRKIRTITTRTPTSSTAVGKELLSSLAFIGSIATEQVENLVHPAMLAHPNPRRVLIFGGCTQHDEEVQAILTEVVRHKSVESVAVVSSLLKKSRHFAKCITNKNDECGTVEYFDTLENLHQHHFQPIKNQKFCQQTPFDVCFSGANKRESNDGSKFVVRVSNIANDTIQTLYLDNILSNNAILVTHLGPSPFLYRKSKMQVTNGCNDIDCDENLQLKLISLLIGHSPFKDLHIFENSSSIAHHKAISYFARIVIVDSAGMPMNTLILPRHGKAYSVRFPRTNANAVIWMDLALPYQMLRRNHSTSSQAPWGKMPVVVYSLQPI